MRPLFLVLGLSVLGVGSYAGLTSGFVPRMAEAGVDETSVVEETRHGVVSVSGPAPPTPPASTTGVRTSVATTTYPVLGATADEILTSMADRGPRSEGGVFFGLTSAELGLRFRPVPVDGGCLLRDVELDLALTITLPEWTSPVSPDPALTRDWNRFHRALAGHEDRHREIAENGAERMVRSLAGLRRESCKIVQDEAQRRVQRLEVEIEESQRGYDSRTDHGRTEGAVWPQ